MTDEKPRAWYQIVEGRHGTFLVNPKDIYIGRSLIEYGEFSEREWAILDRLIPEEAVVIEAGANIGAHTVPMAKKIGRGGLVYAFEPQVLIFQQLCANLALNGLVNVQAFNAGCSDSEGWISLARLDPAFERNYGGVALSMIEQEGATRVRLERLDAIIDPPRLDLIKADVEGMELAVLEGAADLIARHRPILYVEAHEPEKAPALISHILGLDYRLYWHLPRLFNPENHAKRADNLFGAITSKNILCIPAEQTLEVKGAREVTGPDDHPRHWGS